MAVRIRMKKMGRKHRPFFRICAMDARSPRDGKAIEELGTYDPMVPDTDARVKLNHERVSYWLGVGAQPTPKVAVLIRKYGPEGSHLEQQAAALEKQSAPKVIPPLPKPPELKKPEPEQPADGEASEGDTPADGDTPAAAEPPAEAASGESSES